MKYGVMKDGEFVSKFVYLKNANGFDSTLWCREDTYDHYVMKEINKSYGDMNVKGKVVLDVGANIGAYTRWALERNADYVIAFEPEPENFKMLTLNTNYPNVPVVLHNQALTTSKEDYIPLHLSPTGKNPGNSSIFTRRGRNQIAVKNLNVCELIEKHPDIEVMKMDCEGGEYDLLPSILELPKLEMFTLEYHISGFGVDRVKKTHLNVLSAGWECTKQPKIQENLWQTLATYKRK